MFVAGIEIFFGFVAGALILVIALEILGLVCSTLPPLLRTTGRVVQRFVGWVRHRSEWIVGTVMYCWIVFALCESDNALAMAAGSSMAIVLLLAALTKLYFVSNRERKKEKP